MSFLTLTASAYAEIEPDSRLFTLRLIVWGILLGAALGAVISAVSRRALGSFVRAIKRAGAEGPDGAKTLAELGLSRNLLLRSALRTGKPMRRYARCTEDDAAMPAAPREGRFLRGVRRVFSLPEAERAGARVSEAHFYIPNEEMLTAETRYNMKETHLPALIIALAVLVALGLLAEALLPDLLATADNFLSLNGGGVTE